MTFLDQLSGRYGDTYLIELETIIDRFVPEASRFLEWGSGESTRLFCSKASLRTDPLVVSIDDNGEYIRRVSASLPLYPFLHFRHLDLQGPSLSQEDQLPSYSSYPLFMRLEFDVVFIDGRRRAECALTAAQVLTKSGIVIVHDWRRSRYAGIRTLFETAWEGEQFLVLRDPQAGPGPPSQERKDERRAVIVTVSGATAEREAEITLPWTKAYAERIGADCVVAGTSSSLPAARLKYESFLKAQNYDRMLLLDADVIIRPDAPDVFDIVPADQVGAFPEGMFFPRFEWCQELNALYGLQGRLRPQDYFNSGVLVLSKVNYSLIEGLKDGVIFCHPQFEQGFLNARRILKDIPLFPLPPCLNYLPEPSVFPADWRYGFFIHVAGAAKPTRTYDSVWADLADTRDMFVRHTLQPAATRGCALAKISEQLHGRNVTYFDATDFHYFAPHGFPLLDASGNVIAYFPAATSSNSEIAMYGPYVTLSPGTWRGTFGGVRQHDSAPMGALVDVTREDGTVIILAPRPWPQDDQFEFTLEEEAARVEFRIRRDTGAAFEFSYLRLECESDGSAAAHRGSACLAS